jgi:hypothetical protein
MMRRLVHKVGLIGLYMALFSLLQTTNAQSGGDALQQRYQDASAGLSLNFRISHDMPHDARPKTVFVVRNTGTRSLDLHLNVQLQRDSGLLADPPPDLEYGRNLAHQKPSRSYMDGQLLAENTLTDGRRHTHAITPWGRGNAEQHQIIDLQHIREIHHLRYTPSDANWARFVDVMVSESGADDDYEAISELQNLPLERVWEEQDWPEFDPVSARFIRLEYHNKGEAVEKMAMAAQIEVFGKAENMLEAWTPPETGEQVFTFEQEIRLSAGEARTIEAEMSQSPGPGMYLFSWQAGYGNESDEMKYRGYFGHTGINLPAFENVRPDVWEMPEEKRRYGMNMGNPNGIERLREMGISAVRFENHKWDMISPAPGEYRFDGSVQPWRVPHDAYYETFARHNMLVLPYLFHTPPHHSRAPKEARRPAQHPPEDLARFGEFAFQTAARYGPEPHHPDELLSRDKKSRLGLLSTYSLWNEPNLNNPGWGHFIGSLEEYFEMFRHGALGIQRADPQARVATAGFAGTDTALLDRLLRYEYEDGSHPADYADILNVHDYTGRQPPETARVDINLDRGEDAERGLSLEERLMRLTHWRNYRLPGRPVWLTETGYDTGGEQGISRREQAQRIPRLLQIALGSGMDKVFLYRISGDRPTKYAASGIWDSDMIPKPSHYTLATLIHQTDGYDEVFRLTHTDERVWAYAWRHGDRITLSAWSAVHDDADSLPALDIDLGQVQLTDSFGYTRRAEVTENHQLTVFPVYITELGEAAEAIILQKMSDAKTQRERYFERRNRMADADATGWNFGARQDDAPASFDFGRPRFMQPVSCSDAAFFDDSGLAAEAEISRSERSWLRDIENQSGCRMPEGSAFSMMVSASEVPQMLEIGLRGQRVIVELSDEDGQLIHQKTYEAGMPDADEGEQIMLQKRIERPAGQQAELRLRIRFESYGGELHWLRLLPLVSE